MTGYNWENNYSNAGADWRMSNDTYMCPQDQCTPAGITITSFVDLCNAQKAYPLVTLQMAGYVAADKEAWPPSWLHAAAGSPVGVDAPSQSHQFLLWAAGSGSCSRA